MGHGKGYGAKVKIQIAMIEEYSFGGEGGMSEILAAWHAGLSSEVCGRHRIQEIRFSEELGILRSFLTFVACLFMYSYL